MKHLILIIATFTAVAFLSVTGCTSTGTSGGLTPDQQSQLITAGTNVATAVLDAWLQSHPFGAKRGGTINGRDVTTISDEEILASMKQARAAVRKSQPALSYAKADKIVRDVYAKKFGDRVANLRYHPAS